ncbi:MAG TPA: DUF1579 domain-containing protein [Longimicrobium sp.]|jgi:hypothetical protein
MSDAAMHVELTKEHQWLEQMVGEWTCEMEAEMSPGGPTDTHKSRETVRSLGGAWVVCEGEMGSGRTLMALGYDPAKGRFVGSFIGSMMTNQWIYEGELDESGNALVLSTRGPSVEDGSITDYRDTIEIRAPDHRVLTSSYRLASGEWTLFMTAHYRRV